MKFTSEMKDSLKKSYKSIKKGINSFLKKLGFNKKDAGEITEKLIDAGGKEIARKAAERQEMTKKQEQIHSQIRAQSPELNPEVFKNYMDIMSELKEHTKERLTEDQSYGR